MESPGQDWPFLNSLLGHVIGDTNQAFVVEFMKKEVIVVLKQMHPNKVLEP